MAVGILAVLLVAGACASEDHRPLVPIYTPSPKIEYATIGDVTDVLAVDATPATNSGAEATARAATCTGNADNKSFFVLTAGHANFDVYCAVLPSSWHLQKGTYYSRDAGDFIDVFYRGPASTVIELQQGSQCATSEAACAFSQSAMTTIAFGPLSGQLGTYGSRSSPDFVVYVYPGTKHAYTLMGTNVAQADLVAFAAAMRNVTRG